jgi:hypothetical protein
MNGGWSYAALYQRSRMLITAADCRARERTCPEPFGNGIFTNYIGTANDCDHLERDQMTAMLEEVEVVMHE